MDERKLLAALAAPFAPDAIRWRVGPMTKDKKRGMALAYIDARDVMDRLDEVLGINWACRYTPMNDGSMCCEIGVRINDGDIVWRGGGAPPTGDLSKGGNAAEMAVKGGYSDAFKRAAVLWGIGRYLYDLDAPWVELDERKRILPSERARLQRVLPHSSDNRKPEGRKGVEEIRETYRKFVRELDDASGGGREAVDKLIFTQSETVKAWPEDVCQFYNDAVAKIRAKAMTAEAEHAA